MRYTRCLSLIFSLFVAPILFAHTYKGELEVLVFDYFDKKTSKTIYKLHEAGEIYVLKLPQSVDKSNLLHGSQVIVKGREILSLQDKSIQVDTIVVNNKNVKVDKLNMTGTRNILALLVDFNNMRATDTVSIEDVDSILYTGVRSMLNNIQQSSLGQLNFERDSNKNGLPDIYVVNLNYDGFGCRQNDWANHAKQAAVQMGIDLSIYQHIMYVLPQNVDCSWGGLANLGCRNSNCDSWVRAYDPSLVYSQLIYVHELGHNLGMGHSSKDINNDDTNDEEYGDAACFMGVGDGKYLKELNAPHRDQLHWFDNLPDNMKIIEKNGEYVIHPLESGINGMNKLILKIRRNTTDTYYLSYRKDVGVFGFGAPDYLNKVSVHKRLGTFWNTYFIKAMDKDESFIDEENNIYVKVLDTGGNTARVYVDMEANIPKLNLCIYSLTKSRLACYAEKGGLLNLGLAGTIYRKYTGENCAFNNLIYHIPGTYTLTDTMYATQNNLSSKVIGCNVMLCNNQLCNDRTSTIQPIVYSSLGYGE